MGQPAAKLGDQIVATDIHIILIPAALGVPVPTPLPNPFNGIITGNVSVKAAGNLSLEAQGQVQIKGAIINLN